MHFEAGSTTTITRVQRTHYLLQDKSVGSGLPMLYDPADHSYLTSTGRRCSSSTPNFEEEINREKFKEAQHRLRSRDD